MVYFQLFFSIAWDPNNYQEKLFN